MFNNWEWLNYYITTQQKIILLLKKLGFETILTKEKNLQDLLLTGGNKHYTDE